MGSNYRNTSDSADSLKNQGTISAETAKAFGGQKGRKVELPPLGRRGDPIFQCILIDSSGSMDICRKDVINSHHVMVDTLRESSACKRKRLYLGQYLFNSKSHQLNTFSALSVDKSDQIVLLDANNYQPAGTTALYKTLFMLLQELLVVIEHASNKGAFARFGIAVITDGEDNENGVNPQDIKRFLKEMDIKEHLLNSVVVGLLNSQLSSDKLENIKNILGFNQSITCGQNSPKEIRRAFVMASQSTISASS
jgi:hypothetical protein